MLYYKELFNNYEEFKELFGMQSHENGSKSRKNRILLAYLKNKQLLKKAISTGNLEILNISSMAQLRQTVLSDLIQSYDTEPDLRNEVILNGRTFYSSKYETDEYEGICEDSDSRAIRYYNVEQNRIYKMKAGKFYRQLILETAYGRSLPESVLIYIVEELTQEWQTYSLQVLPKHKLFVTDEFERIYTHDELRGDFGSCMTGNGNHKFYENSVSAKAAYLQDHDGFIIARCVIFTKVLDQDDILYRLAERQYSSDGNLILQRLLIDSLIKAGEIDGYKDIGCSCSDQRAFLTNNGESLYNKKFRISCHLGFDEPLSYQDSFAYYDYNNDTAYNFPHQDYSYSLSITDGSIEDDREFDSYNDRYCRSVVYVYVDGNEMTCDENNLEDFTYINDRYYHYDDVSHCDQCDEDYVNGGEYSSLLDEDFCCEYCLDQAESEYRQELQNNPLNVEYDSFHNLHCPEVVKVFRAGEAETCDINRLENFTKLNGQWIPTEEITTCPECNKQFSLYQGCFLDITGMTYCCPECRNIAFEKEQNDTAPEEGTIEPEDLIFDTYHGTEADVIVHVRVEGRIYTCDINKLEEFVLFDNQYHHRDDISECPGCGDRFINWDAFYSDITCEHYCSPSCLSDSVGPSDTEEVEEILGTLLLQTS